MKSYFFILIVSLISIISVEASAQQGNPKMARESNYQSEADSIRKKHLTPRHTDSIENSKTDRMPVLKSDTNKNDPNMPVSKPKSNQHMPVKELSDTTQKK